MIGENFINQAVAYCIACSRFSNQIIFSPRSIFSMDDEAASELLIMYQLTSETPEYADRLPKLQLKMAEMPY